MQEVPQVLDHMVAHIVVSGDCATWGRPANESVQERFVHKLMNEPYLLRVYEEWKRQTQKRRKKKAQRTKGRRKAQSKGKNMFSEPTCRTAFSSH